MAEAVGFLIVEAAATTGFAEGLVAFAEASYLGISGATVIGSAAILTASIGLQYALSRPDVPKTESGSQAIKHSIPPRIRGYGLNRLAGAYMFFEAAGPVPARSYDVIAFHSGRIGNINNIYFHDDYITLDGDLNDGLSHIVTSTFGDDRYDGDVIAVQARLGATSQTAFDIASDGNVSAIWTSTHQGNGIAALSISCQGVADPSVHSRTYPGGRPEASVVAYCSPIWNPSALDQSRADESTWLVYRNPVLQLIDYLTRSDGGMGLDYDTVIAPNIDLWMAEADICDQIVEGEVRYASDGWFQFDNAPESVIGSLLATCDGWLAEAGDGTLILTVGLYREPSEDPLTVDHITGCSVDFGVPDEQLVNQLDITFTDPDKAFVSNQADPFRDEDAISLTGIVRPRQLDLKWVQSETQATRLAARAMQRVNPTLTGTFTTKLYGLNYLGKRWVKLQYPIYSGLEDCVVEIKSARVNWKTGKISWSFSLVDPDEI